MEGEDFEFGINLFSQPEEKILIVPMILLMQALIKIIFGPGPNYHNILYPLSIFHMYYNTRGRLYCSIYVVCLSGSVPPCPLNLGLMIILIIFIDILLSIQEHSVYRDYNTYRLPIPI